MFGKMKRGGHTPYDRPVYQTNPPRPPFDVYMVDDFFPKVSEPTDVESSLTQAILKRNTDLTPSPDQQTNLVNLVSKLQIVLENLSLIPGTFDSCQIEEVRPVGSFKKGTMRTGNCKADIVVILKTLPVIEAVKSLGNKVVEELVTMDPSIPSSVIKSEPTDSGFDISNTSNGAHVRILITTIMPNMRKVDNSIHMPIRALQRHMSAIRHSRWFEESANLTTIKVLIRVLRDMCQRFEGLRPLTPWMIDVLAHYAVTFRHSQPLLPLNSAFKRVLQLLSGGLFLPGSMGIPDPCENGALTMHSQLSLANQDIVCMTAQTLLRVLSHSNGYKLILGLEPDTRGITTNMSVWDEGVVIAPSHSAYEVPEHDEDNGVETKNNTPVITEAPAV